MAKGFVDKLPNQADFVKSDSDFEESKAEELAARGYRVVHIKTM